MERLVRNLQIIGKVPKYGRLRRSIDGVVALEDSTFYTGSKRFLRSEGREQTLRDIRSIVAETEERVVGILDSRYWGTGAPEGDELWRDLSALAALVEGAIIGVENLKITYSPDLTIVAELEVVVMKLRRVSSKLTEAMRPVDATCD